MMAIGVRYSIETGEADIVLYIQVCTEATWSRYKHSSDV
jgi:hypothetical protein